MYQYTEYKGVAQITHNIQKEMMPVVMSQHLRVLLCCLLILVASNATSLCAVSFQLLVLPLASRSFPQYGDLQSAMRLVEIALAVGPRVRILRRAVCGHTITTT